MRENAWILQKFSNPFSLTDKYQILYSLFFLLFTLSFLVKDSLKRVLEWEVWSLRPVTLLLEKTKQKNVFLPIRVLDMPRPFSPPRFDMLFYPILFHGTSLSKFKKVFEQTCRKLRYQFFFFLLDFPWKEKTYKKWF